MASLSHCSSPDELNTPVSNFKFLSLPLELRHEIYHHLLAEHFPPITDHRQLIPKIPHRNDRKNDKKDESRPSVQKEKVYNNACLGFDHPIFAVSCQVCIEARLLAFTRFEIPFSSPALYRSLPGEYASLLKRCAILLPIDLLRPQHQSREDWLEEFIGSLQIVNEQVYKAPGLKVYLFYWYRGTMFAWIGYEGLITEVMSAVKWMSVPTVRCHYNGFELEFRKEQQPSQAQK